MWHRKKINYHQGFTLIELLVVIAIIGVLASTVLANLDDARQSARDAQVMGDMRQIQRALEMYYLEHNEYPCSPGTLVEDMNSGCRDITPYINPIPSSPFPAGTGSEDSRYRYHVGAGDDRSTYTMLFKMTRNDFQWCSISVGAGFSNWNGNPADSAGSTNYPPCF